ncbi:MAG: hypothetical protein GC137_06555 [Alphaproteobacteria bacterium]|nr:hypothetical protein [Alphaproteobacteria bacterium]
MRNFFRATALSAATIFSGCASVQEKSAPPEPLPQHISIEEFVDRVLIDAQRDVEDQNDFRKIHDNVLLALKRSDENDDGRISDNVPGEAEMYRKLVVLEELGVDFLIGGDDEMGEGAFKYDHESRTLMMHGRIATPDDAARGLDYVIRNTAGAFWRVRAKGNASGSDVPLRPAESQPSAPELGGN